MCAATRNTQAHPQTQPSHWKVTISVVCSSNVMFARSGNTAVVLESWTKLQVPKSTSVRSAARTCTRLLQVLKGTSLSPPRHTYSTHTLATGHYTDLHRLVKNTLVTSLSSTSSTARRPANRLSQKKQCHLRAGIMIETQGLASTRWASVALQ